jgi:hypothetical protein
MTDTDNIIANIKIKSLYKKHGINIKERIKTI